MGAPANDSSFPSRLIELGEEAIAAVAAKVVEGAPLVRCQLLASDFFEAWRMQFQASVNDAARRDILTAAGIHCYRMRTAAITPDRMLQELKVAVQTLRSERVPAAPPRKSPPILRVIQGGLSQLAS